MNSEAQLGSHNEVAESEAFKTVYEKASKFDETEKARSVLESSPRIGRVRDNLKQAREALEKGDDNAARKSDVGAVLDIM